MITEDYISESRLVMIFMANPFHRWSRLCGIIVYHDGIIQITSCIPDINLQATLETAEDAKGSSFGTSPSSSNY
jgi:hypothetical protein